MYTKYRLKYGWVWLSVVAALILYLQTISHGYNLDDGLLRAPHIEEEGWKRYVAFFTHPYFDSSTGHKYGYRPVVLISYELERSLLGELPAISHAVNLLIYLSIAVLLYFLLKKLCVGRTQIAGIATLLFILHPLHTEVVASIKNRDELLAFFFFICSYLAYIRYAKIGGWIWVWGLVAATLALLSKKSALVPLLLMPMGLLMIYDRSSTSESKNRARIALVCVSLLVVLFLYSPIGLRKSIVAAILSLGGWTALYLTSNRSTGTRIYGAQVLVCTLLLVGWGIGMVGYEYVLVGVVVGARICQWKWTKKGYWFELIFLGVVTSVACQWSEHMLVWLMGLYVLLWITEYSDSKGSE